MKMGSKAVTVALMRELSENPGLTVKALTKRLGLATPEAVELLRRQARYMRKRGYITGSARSGYTITAWGRQRLQELQFGLIEMKGRWDKKWRVVVFDIPEDKRKARDAIRRLIKQLGFKKLQHSIWIHPLPCFEQFERLRVIHGVRDHILLMEVSSLEDESALLGHFRRIYPDL